MNYIPPPLNDTASITVNKAESALYGIQLTFAQATRPVEYYVRRRIQESPGIDIREDHEALFSSTMKLLLSSSKSVTTPRTSTKTSAEAVSSKTTERQPNFRGRCRCGTRESQ
ncbi:hypothetical protein AYI70_g6214 [Smittium culicis]|uniref:Uncharacterized protein n=1 Tax=Smittium culicis TaxID=133412 RepID=A0A1R1XR17_9FUNG|nr:hypothetical protein AYI70_g6214 [Smittium culicis]